MEQHDDDDDDDDDYSPRKWRWGWQAGQQPTVAVIACGRRSAAFHRATRQHRRCLYVHLFPKHYKAYSYCRSARIYIGSVYSSHCIYASRVYEQRLYCLYERLCIFLFRMNCVVCAVHGCGWRWFFKNVLLFQISFLFVICCVCVCVVSAFFSPFVLFGKKEPKWRKKNKKWLFFCSQSTNNYDHFVYCLFFISVGLCAASFFFFSFFVYMTTIPFFRFYIGDQLDFFPLRRFGVQRNLPFHLQLEYFAAFVVDINDSDWFE